MNQHTQQQNVASAILFDFDGVLVNSVDVLIEVHRLMRPTLTKESFESKWNGNIGDAVFTEPKVRDVNVDEEYHERFKTLPVDDYVPILLKKLHDRSYPMFIVSSTINRTIKEFLDRHGVGNLITGLFGWDVESSKVKKFKMIADGYDVDLEHAVFITDTAGDIYEAREAGIGTIIAITGGYQRIEYLRAAEPDHIVQQLGEVMHIIEDMEKVSRHS